MDPVRDLDGVIRRIARWAGLPPPPPPPGVHPRKMKVKYRREWRRLPWIVKAESSATDGQGSARITVFHRAAGLSPVGEKRMSGVTLAEVEREALKVIRIIEEYR